MKHLKTDRHELRYVPTDDIKSYAANPREHPPAQIKMLKAGIERFGFNAPVLVTPEYLLIAGHGRLLAARELKMPQVPAIILPDLSEDEQRAYRIADNAISQKGTWSAELLFAEASYILDCDLDLGALDLGFETGELDVEFARSNSSKVRAEEAVPPPCRSEPPVSRLGDVWTIRNHKLACADSIEAASFDLLLGTERADTVISDMPWNRPNDDISGLGKTQHPAFQMASGEMTRSEFKAFMRTAMTHQAGASKPGAVNMQYIDWRSVADMISAGEEVYDALINLCVWVKPQGSMGSLWRSRHELVCIFRVKGGKHSNFVELGKHGRNRTNVWEFSAPSALGPERANLAFHATCKNIEMIAEAIKDVTPHNGIVLDAFTGSGTTLLAAERTRRRGRGIEIDPYYVDTAIRRLQEECQADAVRHDGRTFNDIAAEHGGRS